MSHSPIVQDTKFSSLTTNSNSDYNYINLQLDPRLLLIELILICRTFDPHVPSGLTASHRFRFRLVVQRMK